MLKPSVQTSDVMEKPCSDSSCPMIVIARLWNRVIYVDTTTIQLQLHLETQFCGAERSIELFIRDSAWTF